MGHDKWPLRRVIDNKATIRAAPFRGEVNRKLMIGLNCSVTTEADMVIFTIYSQFSLAWCFSETFFPSLFISIKSSGIYWMMMIHYISLLFFCLLHLLPLSWHEQLKIKEKSDAEKGEKLTRNSLWSDVIIRKKDDSSNFCGKIELDCLTIVMTRL